MRPIVDLTIGQRLALSFGSIAILVGLLMALSVHWTGHVEQLRLRQSHIIAPRAEAADHLETAVLYHDIATRSYLLDPSPARREAITHARARMDEELDEVVALPQEPEGVRRAARNRLLAGRYERATDALLEGLATSGHERELGRLLDHAREELLASVREYAASQRKAVLDARQETNTLVAAMRGTAVQLGAIVLALLVLTGWYATRSVRRPAKALVDVTRRLGSGDFEPAHALRREVAGGARRDELAQLGAAVGRMGTDLERLVGELRERNEELLRAREELGAQNDRLRLQQGELEARQRQLHRAIEDLRTSEEILRSQDRKKTEFLAALSHELRNPLAPIRNCLEVLDRVEPGSDQATRSLAVINRQVEHMTHLVDDLLDIARISSGKIQLRRATIDVTVICRAAAEDHLSVFAAAGVELAVEIPARPLWVDGDPSRLAQVVGNLLHNAGKFTPSGGNVLLAVSEEAGRVRIVVRDSGIGMETDTLAELFQPFVQAEVGLARTGGGLGLGLALVKSLVQVHGGSVSARSEGSGLGSELVVVLPLVEDAGSAVEAEPRAPVRARRVLVVEDDPDAALSLRDLLRMSGHQVEVAHDGRSGLRKAREEHPEVLLCDVGLPDMDGLQLARALRADPALQSTVLIAVTGYALPEDFERTKSSGFDAHLAKPLRLDQLERILADLPGTRRLAKSPPV